MKTISRRFFAGFLALCLSLPNPAWAFPNSSTLRAGLEGTVEQELSAGLEEETVALSVPGNLTLTDIQRTLVEALEGETLPVTTGTLFFYLAEILSNTNRHDYHYDGQFHTHVTVRWDDQRVQVTIEDQTQQLFLLKKLLDESLTTTLPSDDPEAFVRELFGQLDSDQNAAAAAGKSILGKMGIPMLKRGYREGVFSIEEEIHTPGRGTRRILVFKKPAAGLEETTDWTLHWDNGGALADESDAFILEKEPWPDFFESLRARSSNARVLDIGSGNLAVSLFAQGVWSGFDLHAIDRANIHSERFPQSDKIQFRRTDIERTGYPDEYFEAVTGRYALEYTEAAHSFPELARILRPGGSGLFLLHHADSNFVRNARRVTIDRPVLPTALETYEKASAYLRNRSAENSRQLVETAARLHAYLDDSDPMVRREAKTAYDNVRILLDMPTDEFQAPLKILGNHIREARFIVNAHHDLVKAALSPEDVPEWTRRLTEASLVVDRFDLFYQDDIPDGWRLEIHKPPTLAGLEESTARSVQLLRQVPAAVPGSIGSPVLVFREPATFDLAALAVRYGWGVAVPDDSPEADTLKELLDALPGPKGRYAVGLLESSRFLNGYQRQIFIENRPEGFKILGLRWDDLLPPVAAALESVLAYLDRATQA